MKIAVSAAGKDLESTIDERFGRCRYFIAMKPPDYHYLFGPVPSRRFGRSLGIDLTPHKTCSLDCVFCQLACISTRHPNTWAC